MPLLLWYLPAILFAGMCQVMIAEASCATAKRPAKRGAARH